MYTKESYSETFNCIPLVVLKPLDMDLHTKISDYASFHNVTDLIHRTIKIVNYKALMAYSDLIL